MTHDADYDPQAVDMRNPANWPDDIRALLVPAQKALAKNDLRAFVGSLEPQVLNGLGAISILLNRPTRTTETWGTVQMEYYKQQLFEYLYRCHG